MDKSEKSKKTPPPPPHPKEIHRLGPMDLKIYSLEGNPRQLTESEIFAKIISVASIPGDTRVLWHPLPSLVSGQQHKQPGSWTS
jgi:hypothetical protein